MFSKFWFGFLDVGLQPIVLLGLLFCSLGVIPFPSSLDTSEDGIKSYSFLVSEQPYQLTPCIDKFGDSDLFTS